MPKEIASSNPEIDNRVPPSSATTQSVDKFASPGIMLFIDQLLIAAGGWAFWMMISRFTSTSDIGNATAIYSLVLLVNTITQLGLEYPLLKKVNSGGSRIFGTVLMIEMAITAASILPIFIIFDNVYQTDSTYMWLAIGILVFSSLSFVGRFALLGASNTKKVLVFDVVGTVAKFAVGFAMLSVGYGVLGILLALLVQALVVAVGALTITGQLFGTRLGQRNIFGEIFKDALANFPSKLSSMLVVSLSVVLLAAYGVASADVGIFYIALMLSLVAGTFASSLAYMSIPASSALKTDLSSGSLRLGLSFTAPIVAALIVAPVTILSVMGDEYTKASEPLIVLAVGILPAVVLSNAISKFNNLNKPSILLYIGSVRIVAFLIAFYLLVPQYGILGASYAIVFSLMTSAAVSLIWSERIMLKYLAITTLAAGFGVLIGRIELLTIGIHPSITIVVTMFAAIAVVFGLKCLSLREISSMIRMVMMRG